MIISPQTGKPLTIEEAITPPDVVSVSFLNQDGSLTDDKCLLNEQNGLVSVEDWRKYGKIETRDGGKKFFLKLYKGGRPGEVLVDPYSLLGKPEDLSAFTIRRGQRFCEYSEVKQSLFVQYVLYLQSRNPIHFKLVERTILNGEGK